MESRKEVVMASVSGFSFTNLIAATVDGENSIVLLGNALIELAKQGKPVSLGIYVNNETLPRFQIPNVPQSPTFPIGRIIAPPGVKTRIIPNGTENGLLPLGMRVIIYETRNLNNVEYWRVGENCWIATKAGSIGLVQRE